MTSRPIHVVVVAYHAPERLERCLTSLERNLQVTVVDNSSSSTVKAVAERAGVAYLDPTQNLGFGAGVNFALRRFLTGRPVNVLLVNPDAVLQAGCAAALAEYGSRPGSEHIAAISPALVAEDGSTQRVQWPFPTPWRGIAEAIGLGCLPARHTYVIGAVVLLRWEALQEVGTFDERFFLYAEEADWQRRALALGWRTAVCPDVTAVHAGAGTSNDPLRREAMFHAAHEVYLRKWYGSAGWFVYRWAAFIGATGRAAVLRGDRRAEASRRAALYARGPRRAAQLA